MRESQSETTRIHAHLLREVIELRDGRLWISATELCLDSAELQYLINYNMFLLFNPSYVASLRCTVDFLV